MANQITSRELRQKVEEAKQNIIRAKDAIHIISQKLDQGSSLCLGDEQIAKINQALMDCVASWSELEKLPGFSGEQPAIADYDKWIADLEKAESIDVLRATVIAYFQIQSSSENYTQMLEDSKKELQNCCRLDAEEIASAIRPYEIIVRVLRGEEIPDEDEDIFWGHTDAVHQVYFKKRKMSIDPDASVIAYMDGSCRLLTDSALTKEVPIPELVPEPEPEPEPVKPLWENFGGYVSNGPIYIEHNPEAEKAFQSKEFTSRMKSHSYQMSILERICDNVIWPVDKPEAWNDKLEDVTYFLNHGYIVRVGYEEGKPLFYALSGKGKMAVRHYFEKINKQPKAMLSQGNYPDLNQLSVLNLKRIYTVLDYAMSHKLEQWAFLRTAKDWFRVPYVCALENETKNDYVLTSGLCAVGTENEDLSEINRFFTSEPDAQLKIIVTDSDDSRCILDGIDATAEQKDRISFIQAD